MARLEKVMSPRDTHLMDEVSTIHDLGPTNQQALAMEVDWENAQYANESSSLSILLDRAYQRIYSRQEDTIYVVIKVTLHP